MFEPGRPESGPENTYEARHKVRSHDHLLCYLLHIFLVVIQFILVVVAYHPSHPEHRVVIPSASAASTIGLSGGLQAFYTLYTTLLVFVTQRLILSSVFSGPTNLTQIHDICGAWCGLGAALSTLWQQTKATSSIFSITLVTVYFVSISVLHVASSTIMQFQPFNATMTKTTSALAAWPDPISESTSSGWESTSVSLIPYIQDLYGSTTQGLANNTLYDVPVSSFHNAIVSATTINSHCGLLTNLSLDENQEMRKISVSMTGLDTLSFYVSNPPLPNEVWVTVPEGNAQPFITYLVSAAIEYDESVNGTSYVHINGTFSPPGGVAQNLTAQIHLVACSFDITTTTATLGSSGVPLVSNKQATSPTWPIFLPGGDTNLTYAIPILMEDDNITPLPKSSHCLPVMSDPYWQNLTAFDTYMISSFGINVSSCDGASSVEPYTSIPYFLTRDKMENVTSKIAAQFVWIAGQLGEAGGGFDRQMEDSQITEYVLQWRLNINALPVISSLCASAVLCVLVICMLWGQNHQKVFIHAAGPLDIMWFGSRSVALRNYMCGICDSSVNGLRISSVVFKMTLWTQPLYMHAAQEDSHSLYTAVPFHDSPRHGTLETFEDKYAKNLQQDVYSGLGHAHTGDISRSRQWCYALHIALVAVHIVLLLLLIYHPEHLVIVPFETTTVTTGLSALLQAIYTLYSALLVFLLQRLAFHKMVGEQRKLTAVHDVSGAWTSIGTAVLVLWKQWKLPSSPWEVLTVVIYLASMLALHITSSSIVQWQAFEDSIHVGVLQSNLALPDSTVNISSQVQWPQVTLISCSTGQDSNLSTYGLSSSTIYDIPQVPGNGIVSEATVNATTFNVQCGLVPNLTLLSDQFSDTVSGHRQYQIGFSLNGSMNNTLFAPPISKDFFHRIDGQCADCPQTLFYMITTAIDVDESVRDAVALNLNWTYVSSSDANPQNSTTVTYVAACSVSTNTVPATLNLENRTLTPSPNETNPTPSPSWSVWSPVAATNLNAGMVTAFSKPYTYFLGGLENSSPIYYTPIDRYMMTLLGWNVSALVDVSTVATHSSTNPSVSLTPAQLENTISQTAARFIWVAGLLGETNGGFDRIVGQSPARQNVLQWRLNINTIPVVFASAASFIALAATTFVLGRTPVHARPSSVSGTTVLESLWLEANSEVLHSRLLAVDEPDPDKLREAGMFDICLGDIQAGQGHLQLDEGIESEATLNENRGDEVI